MTITRAIHRAGELIRLIEKGKTGPKQLGGVAPTKLSRTQAAKDSGFSKDQYVTTMRVGNVPKEVLPRARGAA